MSKLIEEALIKSEQETADLREQFKRVQMKEEADKADLERAIVQAERGARLEAISLLSNSELTTLLERGAASLQCLRTTQCGKCVGHKGACNKRGRREIPSPAKC